MDPLDFTAWEQQAQQRQQQRHIGGLNLRFFTEAVQSKLKSEKEGRPIFDMVDMVEMNVPGSRDTSNKKCSPEVLQKYQIEPQYQMWKATQAQPVTGTPLTEVPFLNIAQIKEYNALNVMSLEQLADLSDTAIQKLGMGAMEARRKAQAYMKAAGDSAQIQQVIGENEQLKREVALMRKQITEVNSRYELLLSGEAPAPAAVKPNGDAIANLIRAELERMKTQGEI